MFKIILFLFNIYDVNNLALISRSIIMIKNNYSSTSSKKIKKPYKCRNCYIIRLFLLAVVFVLLFALIQSDNLHYLDFVTPSNAATIIIISGVIMFLVKLTKHIIEKKKS